MTFHALDIPEDLAERGVWLDRHLVSLELGELVAELSAFQPVPPESVPSARALLGEHLGAVLNDGLAAVPPEVVRRLLLQPILLLDLQELVLTHGGDYWDRVKTLSTDIDSRVERGEQRLDLLIKAPRQKLAWFRQPWFVSLATAASILVAVLAYGRYRNPSAAQVAATQAAWGWNRTDALRPDFPASAYLNRLADGAGDWFKERPQEPFALARRISEFRQGCTLLILTDHKPLSDADRKWLLVRCRLWAGKLDKHLAALEAGRDPLQVRDEVDETIRDLIQTMQARAEGVASL